MSKDNLLDYSTEEGQHIVNENNKRVGLSDCVDTVIEAVGLLASFKPIKTTNGLKRYTVINVISNGKLIADHLNITLDGSDNIFNDYQPQWEVNDNEMTHLVKLKGVVKPYVTNPNKFNICLIEKPIFMTDRFERDEYGYMCVPPEKKWNILKRLSLMSSIEKLLVIDKLQDEINGLSMIYYPDNFIFIYALNTLTLQTQTMKIESTMDNTWVHTFNDITKIQMIHLLCIVFGYLNNSPVLDIYDLFKIITTACLYQQGFKNKIVDNNEFRMFCNNLNINMVNIIKAKMTLMKAISKNFNIHDTSCEINHFNEYFDYLGVIDYILDEMEKDKYLTPTRHHI